MSTAASEIKSIVASYEDHDRGKPIVLSFHSTSPTHSSCWQVPRQLKRIRIDEPRPFEYVVFSQVVTPICRCDLYADTRIPLDSLRDALMQMCPQLLR